MINSVGLPSLAVKFLTQSNENNARNAYVCEMNGNHIPNNAQSAFIKMVVEHYEKSESRVSRDEIAVKIKEYIDDVYKMRCDVFEIVNDNTNQVYGRLKENCTEVDRDKYIQKLNALLELNDEIKRVKDYKGFASGKVDDALYLHHSCSVYGDLQSLSSLQKGERSQVPELTYNRGSSQFG